MAATQRDLERDEITSRCQHSRRRAKVQLIERITRFAHTAKQKQPPNLKEHGVQSIVVIA